VNVQISGGLSVFPNHADSGTQLVQQAKLAMSNAMQSGAQLLLFSDTMKPHPQKLQLMSDLKTVVAQEQLQWALQPQYCVNEHCVMGSEMLVRWHHPDYGWVSPGDFVVWAEQMGNVSEITRAAIRNACRLLEQLKEDTATLKLSVNLSANDLANTKMVKEIIDSVGSNASHLTLEITETALMKDIEKVQKNVELLKQVDIKLSLDDYGTGYSSLEYLKAFNFDEIKIDQMFINDMTRIDRNLQLTKASIELGHKLGALVVAEGVEDRETADILIDMGCDILQGYYIGRPQVTTDVAEYMSTAGSFRMEQKANHSDSGKS
jgi:EAL domain-containing protein (putative c-di-GMP-specific phosphodiesterase class I)